MEAKLAGAVGDPKCKDPKPSNKPKDIATVEVWLLAQGAKIEMKGKVTPAMIKWIRAYQGSKGKLKKDEVNGVMTPGDKTWNAGATNYHKYREKILKYEAYEVVENGKTKRVPVHEFLALEMETRRRILSNAKAVQSEADQIMKMIQGVLDTMAGQEGYLNAFAALATHGFGLADPPSNKNAMAAYSAASAVVSAVDRTKVNWGKVDVLARKAQKAHKKAVKEWQDYNKSNTKNAEWAAFGANICSEAAFGTLEVLATGYMVTTKGMSPKNAQIAAAVGVEGLKTSAGEVGLWAANDKFDATKSTRKVLGNMLIAGIGAAAGGKMGGDMLGKVLKKVNATVASKLGGRLASHTNFIVEKLMNANLGKELMKSAIAEAGNLAKDVNSGKKVDEKRLIEAVAAVISVGLIGSAEVKALKKFDNTWLNRSYRLAQEEFGPILKKKASMKLVTRFPKGEVLEMMQKEGVDIIANTVKKQAELINKTGFSALMNHITGSEKTPKALEDIAVKRMKKDSALIAKLEVAMMKEAEARLQKASAGR